MLPRSVDMLLRITGIIISIILALSPWLITPNSIDPFSGQAWLLFFSAGIALGVFSVVGLFFRPRNRQIPFLKPVLLVYTIIVISTILSPFLVSLRAALIWCSLLGILIFLRVTRKKKDNFILYFLVVLNGYLISIYALFQYIEKDIISWSSTKFVGIFGNQNYFAAYLLMTCILSFKFLIDSRQKAFPFKILAIIIILPQVLALYLTNCIGAIVALGLGIFLFSTSFWEKKPGRILKSSPFKSGLILAVMMTLIYGIIVYSTQNYHWEKLNAPPVKYLTVVSRLLLWQMGFSTFANHPAVGAGLDSSSYLLTGFRPSIGTSLSLKVFNDTIHSIILKILAELGFLGLFFFCCLFASFMGIHTWKSFRTGSYEAEALYGNISVRFLFFTAILLLISGVLNYFSIIPVAHFYYSIPIILILFVLTSICWSPMENGEEFNHNDGLSKVLAISVLVFIFHSIFNDNSSVLPLLTTFVLIVSLHTTSCLNDVKWKKSFSYLSLAYICFPVMFTFCVYFVQTNYEIEQEKLYKGDIAFTKGNYVTSNKHFRVAIKANPQSLKAHYGLAMSLRSMGQSTESQEVLNRLDSMVPNVFNSKLELAKILFERKKILDAHRYALKSLAWNRTPEAYELLGKILIAEGRVEEAEKMLEEGLIFIPIRNYKEAGAAGRIRLLLASMAARKGDFKKAESYLKAIGHVKTDLAELLYLKGLIAHHKKNRKKAISYFERALRQNSENPRYMNAVGFLLTQKGINLSRAETLLQTAYSKFKQAEPPMLSDILTVTHSLGMLYWKLNKIDKAEQLLKLAYSECPREWKKIRIERLETLKQFLIQNDKMKLLKEIEEKEKIEIKKEKRELLLKSKVLE